MGGNRSKDRLGIDHLPHVSSNDIQSGRRIPIQTWCSFGGRRDRKYARAALDHRH